MIDSIKVKEREWTVDSTRYGVDIFCNGVLKKTMIIEDRPHMPKNFTDETYWLNQGMRWVRQKEGLV